MAEASPLQSFPAAGEYLSCIYLIRRDYGAVANARLAQWMRVSTSAVNQAVGRLRKLGLADQPPYGSIELSPAGEALAKAMLRRHYLIEHLLVGSVGYPWDKADAEAHRLQGQISDELADHLERSLGHPRACPHGNPFPDSPDAAAALAAPRLDAAPAGAVAYIVRISEEGEAVDGLLRACQDRGIKPGAVFEVAGADGRSIGLRRAWDAAAPIAELPLGFARHVGARWN